MPEKIGPIILDPLKVLSGRAWTGLKIASPRPLPLSRFPARSMIIDNNARVDSGQIRPPSIIK